MTFQSLKPLFAGAAVAASLVFVAACSGTSSSMNPTAPTAAANSTAAGANFSPNPACLPPNTIDPISGDCVPPVDLASGRFTGGGFQFTDDDIKVTRGFTLHCDNILANNLEINWAGGNNFHMEKNTLINVACTKPTVPNPPAADVSRIVADAVGECNGLPASIHIILEDRGEPGTNDRASFVITGGCSLNLSERPIDGGNIQAHFDQPHK